MGDLDTDPLDFHLLIGEIETGSGGSIAAAIRKLREQEIIAYNAGVGGPTGELVVSFISALNAQAQERNLEIEKTCAHHYQGFLEAARELSNIQKEAASLRYRTQDLGSNLAAAVKSYSDSCNELSNCKVTLSHIDQCIEAITKTMPILDQYSRVQQSIVDGRFYHALRTLEDLERTQLTNVRLYAFSQVLSSHIPKMRAEIKNASLTELTNFLEHIRKHSTQLGVIAMRQVAKGMGMDVEALLGSGTDGVDSSTAPKFADSSGSPQKNSADQSTKLAALNKELDELYRTASDRSEESSTASTDRRDCNQGFIPTEDLVDFGPVYRCLHIHTALHERAQFERHYCTERRKQCQLRLGSTLTEQVSTRNYYEFLGGICGFFVVDDHLRHTLSGASSSYQTYLDELWGSTVERLVAFARLNANSCSSPIDLIRLKDYAVLFIRTMNYLDFNTTALSEMITWIQRSYQLLLSKQWRTKFEQIINNDTFRPIQILDSKELSQLTEVYPPSNTPEFNALPYPRQLCYSWMVPRIYATIKEYIDLCSRFSAHVGLSYGEVEDTVNRATAALFTDCLNTVMHKSIRRTEHELPRLLQLCINFEELDTACRHLDSYLRQLVPAAAVEDVGEVKSTWSEAPSSNIPLDTHSQTGRSRLDGSSLLMDNRSLLDSLIYENLNSCVDRFIDKINYSQSANEANGDSMSDLRNGAIQLKPNKHIMEMTAWLSTTFRLFANVPVRVSQTACMTVCKHIRLKLHNLLANSQFCVLTERCTQQMSADLAQCELFAQSLPIPGSTGDVIPLIFADLRQLLDLFRKNDWSVFIETRGKAGAPYDRVSPNLVMRLLESIKESEKKRSGFLQSIVKGDRDRKKRIDSILQQLRKLS